MSKSSLLFRQQWINNWLNADIDKPLKDLVRDTEQRYWLKTLWVPYGLHWLWDHDYKHSSLDLSEILSQCKQEEKKSHNWNFKSGPGALTGFKCLRAAVNSLCEKPSKIGTGFDVVTLQRSGTS